MVVGHGGLWAWIKWTVQNVCSLSSLVWSANKEAGCTPFFYSSCSFEGFWWALVLAGSTFSTSLPALGYTPSQPWPVYIQGDADEGLASLPDAKQPQLAPLDAEEKQLNCEALWTVWLLSVSWIPSPVSMSINLILAAWIHNRIHLVTTQSSWVQVKVKIKSHCEVKIYALNSLHPWYNSGHEFM